MSDGGMKSPAGISADSVSRGQSGINAPSHANPPGGYGDVRFQPFFHYHTNRRYSAAMHFISGAV